MLTARDEVERANRWARQRRRRLPHQALRFWRTAGAVARCDSTGPASAPAIGDSRRASRTRHARAAGDSARRSSGADGARVRAARASRAPRGRGRRPGSIAEHVWDTSFEACRMPSMSACSAFAGRSTIPVNGRSSSRGEAKGYMLSAAEDRSLRSAMKLVDSRAPHGVVQPRRGRGPGDERRRCWRRRAAHGERAARWRVATVDDDARWRHEDGVQRRAHHRSGCRRGQHRSGGAGSRPGARAPGRRVARHVGLAVRARLAPEPPAHLLDTIVVDWPAATGCSVIK